VVKKSGVDPQLKNSLLSWRGGGGGGGGGGGSLFRGKMAEA